MNAQTAIEPVHKTLVVRCSPEHAFEVFTRGIGSWWPVHTHSIGDSDTITDVVFEERVGGRISQRHSDGSENDWGRVVAWDPPAAFTMSWFPTGRERPTELEVRFAAEGKGTRVDLEHRGWEVLADEAQETRNSYQSGWDRVLDHYTRHLNG
jgi:uncharacterized protein YndB with AHSA1/START domain